MNAPSTLIVLLLLVGQTFADDVKATLKITADPNPKSLLIAPSVQADAQRLVAQLGNKSFSLRQDALSELRTLGRLALPAIEEGLSTSTVLEVTLWCEQLLPQARSQDLKARVECFLADTESKYKHALPGANEFFKITGTTEAARTLFKEIWLSRNRDLFLALSVSPDEAAKAVTLRRSELQSRSLGGIRDLEDKSQPTSAEVLAVLFIESMIPERLTVTAAQNNMGRGVLNPTTILTQSALRLDLEKDTTKDIYTALLMHWYETREETRTMYYCLSSANVMRVSPPIKLAKKLLERKDATPMYKAQAICQLGRGGNKEDVEALLPLLKDDTVVSAGIVVVGANGNQVRSNVLLQDTALAMIIVLHDQNPTDYGYTERYPSKASSTTLKFNYMNYYFNDEDSKAKDLRTAVRKKWEEKQAADKKLLKK